MITRGLSNALGSPVRTGLVVLSFSQGAGEGRGNGGVRGDEGRGRAGGSEPRPNYFPHGPRLLRHRRLYGWAGRVVYSERGRKWRRKTVEETRANISREEYFFVRVSEAEFEAARGRVKRWREGGKEGILAFFFNG